MSKIKTAYFCQNCGYESAKWSGKCPSCQQWNTFVEEKIVAMATDAPPSWDSSPIPFPEITGVETPRVSTGIAEFDRVLGGKRELTWNFNSRTQCLQCHNFWAEYAIGFSGPRVFCLVLAEGETTLGCVDREGRVQPLPEFLQKHSAGEPGA